MRQEPSEKYDPMFEVTTNPASIDQHELTYYEVIMLYEAGLAGFKESRTILCHLYPSFALARDTEVDDEFTTERMEP